MGKLTSRTCATGPVISQTFIRKNHCTVHSDKVTAWVTLSSDGVIGPYFNEVGGETATVISERYVSLLKSKFLPSLRKKGFDKDEIYFQQDGAAPHTSNTVLEWLDDTFGRRLISLKTELSWPPHSPDLNPLDFFLWGFVKSKVYCPPPSALAELKTAIRREIRKIDTETCKSVIQNFRARISAVKTKRGGHMEHLL